MWLLCCQLYIGPFTKVVSFDEVKVLTHGTGEPYGRAAAAIDRQTLICISS
jgi:hypothetical protein